ncbi:MAG: lipase, partial [Leptospiraceae bacterium]|nr:lipase [Leptospiraceae bacterium]
MWAAFKQHKWKILLMLGSLPLLLELSLRFFQPAALDYERNLKLLHVYHPEYLVGLEPHADYYIRHNQGLWEGHFTTNSLGYRGSREPVENVPQIGCLGDSLVMGFGVSDEDTFCNLLNGIKINGTTYQTQNLGVDAFGTRGYYYRLKEATERLPDLRIVLFFPSPNDFVIPESLRQRGILPDDEVDRNREQNPESFRQFKYSFQLTRYSVLLHSGRLAVAKLNVRRRTIWSDIWRDLYQIGLYNPEDGPVLYPQIPVERRGLFPYLREAFYNPPPRPDCNASTGNGEQYVGCPDPIPHNVTCLPNETTLSDLEPLPEYTRAYYDRMIAAARSANVRLVMVMMPVQNETLYCEMNGQYSPFFDFSRRAGAYFKRQNVPVLDMR